ncbi:unnamed protein product [Polarella glacialis]|uniref:C2 domain-containing protein n=1 Tax=Polarella glacialis TaxID=89957 RepID=A0A813HZF9_POLGL|nr:unnamed protein product [Polarella glacialis]CAE8662843.1 unnamed protein product [Polarella glacialis]
MFCGCLGGSSPPKPPSGDVEDEIVSEVVTEVVTELQKGGLKDIFMPSALGNTGGQLTGPLRDHLLDPSSSLGWVNFILVCGWPHMRLAVNAMAQRIFAAEMTTALRSAREASKVDIDVETRLEFDIGNSIPNLTNIQVIHDKNYGGIEGIELSADLDMTSGEGFSVKVRLNGTVAGIPMHVVVGVKSFKLNGTGCLMLSPLLDKIPVFSGFKFYFLDLPQLDYELKGINKAGKILGSIVSNLIKTVTDKLLNKFVVPGGIYIPLVTIPPALKMKAETPEPDGYIVVNVHEAKGVFGGDMVFFSKETSDPSVKITLGSASFESSYKANTSTPKWDPPESAFLPVLQGGQIISFAVEDVDVTVREVLGTMSCAVGKLYDESKGRKRWLEMNLTEQGRAKRSDVEIKADRMGVCVSTEFLAVTALPAAAGPVRELASGLLHALGGPRQLTQDFVPLLRLCTVKLLGLDCSPLSAEEIFFTTAIVQVASGTPPKGFFKEVPYSSYSSITDVLPQAPQSGGVTVSPPLRSKKAKKWGAEENVKGSFLPNVSPQAQLMIERLSKDKGMSIAEIASVADLPEDQVKLLVGLDRSLQVAWHQAFHQFMEYPGGTVTVEVTREDHTSLGTAKLDLAEVEASPDKTKTFKVPLEGNRYCTDLHLVLEIELKGFKRGELEPHTVSDRFADANTCASRQVLKFAEDF